MTEKDFEEAKLLWKMFFAKDSFRECEAAAQHILDNKLEHGDALYYPLVTAVYVLYAKPFTTTHGGVGKLDASIVPVEKRDLHKQLLDHRNQFYAHRDAAPTSMPENVGHPVVFFRVNDTTVQLHGSDFAARHPMMPEVIDLCRVLQEKADYYKDKMGKRHLREIPGIPGDYLLNIRDLHGPFVERMEFED